MDLHDLVVLALVAPLSVSCSTDVNGPLPQRLVSVQPATLELEVGETVRLSVDVAGATESATWETSDPMVAAVNGAGVVTAKSVGSAVITARVSGGAGSASVTVIPRAFARQTWELYSSTEDFRSSASADGLTEVLGLDGIYVDFDRPPTGLTRSLRYDYVNQGTGARHRGIGIPLPEPVAQVWVEVWFRLSDNYRPCHPNVPPCDHKFVFLQFMQDGDGRAEVHLTGGGQPLRADDELVHFTGMGHGSTQRFRMIGPSLGALKDGTWHRLGLYGRVASAPGVPDGALRVWIDGSLRGEITDAVTDQPGQLIRAVLIGRNKDKGLDNGTESVWIGPVRAWKIDPGW